MTKPILVLNCGSSSIKYQLIDVESEQVLASGLADRVADPSPGLVRHTIGEETFTVERLLPDHATALTAVFDMFHSHGPRLEDVRAVAHRAVHGGDRFSAPTLITDEVLDALRDLVPLAPLHNPAGIAGIEAARRLLPNLPQVAIFDTAFFADLPAEAYTYAIDTDLASRNRIRRYGFHGTSHEYVAGVVPRLLGADPAGLKQIVCHLGNGASISAIDGGRPIDTSMGLTPLQGLVMGTRSGDVDPGMFAYLQRQEGWDAERLDAELNQHSGMLGLAGRTDMRDVEAAVLAGEPRAVLAGQVYLHRLVFYIGGYDALLGGADAITFTAGVGENSDWVRREVCTRLTGLGVVLDEDANRRRSKQPRIISTPDSRIAVLVVPTNEELAMARQAAQLLSL